MKKRQKKKQKRMDRRRNGKQTIFTLPTHPTRKLIKKEKLNLDLHLVEDHHLHPHPPHHHLHPVEAGVPVPAKGQFQSQSRKNLRRRDCQETNWRDGAISLISVRSSKGASSELESGSMKERVCIEL